MRFLVRKKKQDVKNGSLLQREDVIYGMGGLIRTYHVCIYVYTYIRMYVHTHTYVCTYTYVCMCIHIEDRREVALSWQTVYIIYINNVST